MRTGCICGFIVKRRLERQTRKDEVQLNAQMEEKQQIRKLHKHMLLPQLVAKLLVAKRVLNSLLKPVALLGKFLGHLGHCHTIRSNEHRGSWW